MPYDGCCTPRPEIDRSRSLDIANLVNREASAEGDWTMEVFLDFDVDGHRWQLRRTVRPKDTVARPRKDGDFQCEVQMRCDGEVIRGDLIEHEISRILPQQVSRFALFDGELLQEYELLLYEDSEQGERIKGEIEQVLGVPALTSGRDEAKGSSPEGRAAASSGCKAPSGATGAIGPV